MVSRTIISQIGTKQELLRDRETYPKALCNSIENIITCNLSNIESNRGTNRIRFMENGKLVVQMSIEDGRCIMSDESSSIVCIRLKDKTIKSSCYYGKDCVIDFKLKSNEYSLDSIEGCLETLKNFYNSWIIDRGFIGAFILIIDDYRVFEKVLGDSLFSSSYLICSE